MATLFDLSASATKRISRAWNGWTPKERLEFLLSYYELFWSLGLITQSELRVVEATSRSNRDYVMEREDQPFFTSIDLKKEIENQIHQEKLKTALNAVFSKIKRIKNG